MARYIDAEKVMEEIARIGGHNFCKWHTIGVKALIDRQPTADVAPRSEVAREIFEEIEANINALEYNAKTPRKTVSVDELKAQMDWVLREVIPGTLAKIKQKYTEEQK